MRVATLVAALPAAAVAQQIPILDQVKGWFAQASASVSSVVSNIPTSASIPNPIASGAAKVAKLKVEPITLDNYKQVIQPQANAATPGQDEWMIMVTGGNKTCYGLCERAERAWNESVALMSAAAKDPPHLGLLDCETNDILCQAWFTGPPQIVYITLPRPQADQSPAGTAIRYIGLNYTAITATELANLQIERKFAEWEIYDGFLHPFDGPLAKTGLNIPLGYVMWAFARIPSYAIMIGVSLFSRSLMSRRNTGPPRRPAAPAST